MSHAQEQGDGSTETLIVKALTPPTIAPPFARYSHGVAAENAAKLVTVSGQLGMALDGTIPGDVEAQADICFANCDAVLAEAGLTRANVVHVRAFVTDRAYMSGYMKARDSWMAQINPPPASTLMIVSGFTKPEFKVEIEVLAMS
ncbi:MAG: RidA family protein [Pseudomonadota bacterium]